MSYRHPNIQEALALMFLVAGLAIIGTAAVVITVLH